MIVKKDLLLKAQTDNDIKRLEKLLEYDYQEGGVMLYRYRHVSDGTVYEIDALKDCKIWVSTPKFFDDKNEFLPTNISIKDYECVRFFLETGLANMSPKERKRKLAEIDKIFHSNPRAFLKFFISVLEKRRCEYAVSCFTENSPFDTNHNMWHQYAKDSGICLGYSLKTLIKAKVIIDPVYYVDSKEKSLAEMYELFGKSIRIALCYCIKEKYGYDQNVENSDLLCWRDQNEWRYAVRNIKDESKNTYVDGYLLDREIVPDVVYVKNLSSSLYEKVVLAASSHGIVVECIS